MPEVGAARGQEVLSRPRFLVRACNESVAITREKIEQRMDDLHAALAVLQDALNRCRHENMRTPEVLAALDLLETNADPKWPFAQFREALDGYRSREWEQEGRWQTLNASLNGIRLAVARK